MNNYRNPSLSPAQRAEDLLSRMSLEQKIGQLQCDMAGDIRKSYPNGVGEVSMILQGIGSKEEVLAEARRKQETIMSLTPFGIPAIMHVECLTGGVFPGAVSYPTAIAQASTWQPELLEKMTQVIGRQMHTLGLHQGFAPVMDISRDPRWGRQGETYGEDPTLASAMSSAFVRGLQSGGDVIATAKHFLGYAFGESGLNAGTNHIPPRRLREVYAKPFQAAITEAGLRGVMNSYGSIDGEPIVSSKKILTELLRDEMKFKGFVISDYMSVGHPCNRFKTAEDMTDSGIQALMAGLDSEAPFPESFTAAGLKDAVESGKLDIMYIDRACRRILEAKFAIGLFEHPFGNEAEIPTFFDVPAYEEESLRMAEKSLVLLKNDGVLPLEKNVRKIALIGPHMDNLRAMFGGYSWGAIVDMIVDSLTSENTGMAGIEKDRTENAGSGLEELSTLWKAKTDDRYPGSKLTRESPMIPQLIKKYYPKMKTIFEQLKEEYPDAEICYAHGYDHVGNDRSGFEEAYRIAADADIILVSCGGKYGWGMSVTTGEGADSAGINLPGIQEEFLTGLSKLGKSYVALHFDGRPVSSDELDCSASAILECWNPGEHGAEAIVRTLFGDNNPAGRLPVTVARSAGQIPIYYAHENGNSWHGMDLGKKGYVDETFFPRYYFGYGLSYTSFDYHGLEINADKEELTVSIDVTNSGECDGDEVVQLYVKDCVASILRPVKELAGFRRISLKAGETKKVTFVCRLSQFAFLDTDMKWKVETGRMQVQVGASSEDIRAEGEFSIGVSRFIEGEGRGFYAETCEEVLNRG